MQNYSFSNDQNGRSFTRLEQSIMKEYERLNFGQATLQYSIDSIKYTNLPQNLPDLIHKNGRCVQLTGCGFFEMITYAVFQFLLKIRSPEKDQVLKKIKKNICDKNFMQSSPSTKGLLLKGMKLMYDISTTTSNDKPIAHSLWKTDSMLAFSQFWKSLLAKVSLKNIMAAESTIKLDSGIFQLLADYLQINMVIYYMQYQQLQHQVYNSRTKASSLQLNIIISSSCVKNEDSQILNCQQRQQKDQVHNSRIEWTYIIIEDRNSQLENSSISQIQPVDESQLLEKSQLLKMFKCKTKSELNLFQRKQNDHLETARTKRSELSRSDRQRVNTTYQTDDILVNIRHKMQQGDKLICNMRQYCDNLLKVQ